MDWPVPIDIPAIRSFIGIVGYYRRFMEGFSSLAYPTTSLHKKGVRFEWTTMCQKFFEQLKLKITTSPILNIVDPNK